MSLDAITKPGPRPGPPEEVAASLKAEPAITRPAPCAQATRPSSAQAPDTGCADRVHLPVKRRRGRPVLEVTKVPTSIRLDIHVLNAFKAAGHGWQTRMNQVLLEYARSHDMLG